jgi:5-hydroxyisourate hydrolase
MRHANLDSGAAAGFAAAVSPIGETDMMMEFDRRSLLQAGAIAGAAAASAAPANAQHAPAKLSTHALDMYLGKQAAGIRIDFSKKEGDAWKLIKTVTADENGRVGEQLMSAETIAVGRYELLFYVEDYYKKAGVKLSDPSYLDTVPVRIAIFDAKQSYHVPLYFSPWSILSYRGS